MDTYLFAAFIIFLMNALPAFAPPTWSILVFFAIRYELEPALLIPVGVIGASSGRWVLALYFRKLRDRLPKGWVTNMENAGTHFRKSAKHSTALFLLFFLSPLSSAQLFEAAGVMKNQPLRPLIGAFAAGRVLTYSIYVTGAHAISSSNLGELIREKMTSPSAIAIQILMVLALVLLGNIKWKPALNV
ncbi:MAG: hypothetical protein RL355_1199 [Actinomycetota bacterium]|jgi:hypothetical protein